MKKKIILMLLSVLVLMGCAEKEEVGTSITYISNGEVVSAYVNGVDVTDERKALEEKLKDSVSEYYGINEKEIEFQTFCMLGVEMMTVEVEVQQEWYLVTGDTEGEILSVNLM